MTTTPTKKQRGLCPVCGRVFSLNTRRGRIRAHAPINGPMHMHCDGAGSKPKQVYADGQWGTPVDLRADGTWRIEPTPTLEGDTNG